VHRLPLSRNWYFFFYTAAAVAYACCRSAAPAATGSKCGTQFTCLTRTRAQMLTPETLLLLLLRLLTLSRNWEQMLGEC
jgi:hypothetical protein